MPKTKTNRTIARQKKLTFLRQTKQQDHCNIEENMLEANKTTAPSMTEETTTHKTNVTTDPF